MKLQGMAFTECRKMPEIIRFILLKAIELTVAMMKANSLI
jgi:hypothetical protein